MVFKRHDNKLDCRQCLSITSFYKTVCVKSRYPPFHPVLCYRYRDVYFCCTYATPESRTKGNHQGHGLVRPRTLSLNLCIKRGEVEVLDTNLPCFLLSLRIKTYTNTSLKQILFNDYYQESRL